MTEAILRPDGLLLFQGRSFPATFGKGGIVAMKQEGDGGTPLGLLPLRRLLYRADRVSPPRAACPIEPLSPEDGWCDDPASPLYNQPVRLPCEARHEELWRRDGVYDIIGVLGWNDMPPVKDRGSAIFLHVETPDRAPTAGCVALSLANLKTVLAAGLTAVRVLEA